MGIISVAVIIGIVLLTVAAVKKIEGEADKPPPERLGTPHYYRRLYPSEIYGDRAWRENIVHSPIYPTGEPEIDRYEAESKRAFAASLRILDNCLRASPKEYVIWLRGYLAQGGEIHHDYDYGLPDNFYTALSGITLVPLWGSASLDIIVPKGVNVKYTNLGHNNLYFMDGFKHAGGSVAVYEDTQIK